ncbi:MAG: hypothetical protein SO314_05530 [Alphaproteobacteria bacterium]|nr:hypothetical protein [Alphaproteobacteria bacterium]
MSLPDFDPARGSSGTDTCGYTCYRCCDDTCSSGSRGGASCSSGYDEVYVGSTECGSSCYGCEKHYHSYSCPYGYSSSSSSCNYGYDIASKSCSCGVTSGTCYK